MCAFLLLVKAVGSKEQGQKERKFDERECDQHNCLQLADCFWLASHASHRAVPDKGKSKTCAKNSQAESDHHHGVCVSSLVTVVNLLVRVCRRMAVFGIMVVMLVVNDKRDVNAS